MLTSDVPVLINFFNRAEPLKKVFEAVRAAKPKYLFLSQDGAREGNESDAQNVLLCREVVENIDWDCQVFRNYSQANLGCGRRMSSAITWAFEHVDRLIILEDDCVPSQDFFPFCDELLEKYKDDPRVSMISAMNHLECYSKPDNSSYIFCNSGAIWAWATWKRQWQLYDFEMKALKNTDIFEKIKNSNYPSYYKRDLIVQGKDRMSRINKGEKLSSWTFQFNIIRFLQHQLTIVPCVNLMSNVGLTCESTHASSDIKQIPKGLQSIFYMKHQKMSFPLRHPDHMCCDDLFDRLVWKKLGLSGGIALYRKIESVIRQLLFGNHKKLFSKLWKKLGFGKKL